MLAEFNAVLLSGAINCSDVRGNIESSIITDVALKNSLVAVCQSFPPDYEKIIIYPLKLSALEVSENLAKASVLVGQPVAGKIKVTWMDVREHDKEYQVTLKVAFEAYKSVWVFSNDLNADSLLKQEDVTLKTLNVAPFLGIRNFVEGNPVGKRLIKYCNKGQIIFNEYLSAPLLVKKNMGIKAVLIDNGLKIEMDAVSLEDADKLNQKIKIRVLASGAVLTGILEGKDTVYVKN